MTINIYKVTYQNKYFWQTTAIHAACFEDALAKAIDFEAGEILQNCAIEEWHMSPCEISQSSDDYAYELIRLTDIGKEDIYEHLQFIDSGPNG